MRICEREPRDKRAGIIPAVLQRDFYGNESARGHYLDAGAARRVAKALDEAGIRPSPRQRKVGDYVLKELIEENPFFAYQDFQAEHPTTQATRRVRVYNVAGKDKAADESIRRSPFRNSEYWKHSNTPDFSAPANSMSTTWPRNSLPPRTNEIRLDHYKRTTGNRYLAFTFVERRRKARDRVPSYLVIATG